MLAAFFCLVLVSFLSAKQTVIQADQASASQRTFGQSPQEASKKSSGCLTCHNYPCNSFERCENSNEGALADNITMHPTGTVVLGCTDCHGGNATKELRSGVKRGTAEYDDIEEAAHVVVSREELHFSRNHEREYANWLKRSKEYIQFVNPGDLRVAGQTCGRSGCHSEEVKRVRSSMMTHGAMLWAAALYNNGAFPIKDAHFGESYDEDGFPQALKASPTPTQEETHDKGVLPSLLPLERWEVSQPGNVLRVFERGGGAREEIGNPQTEELPGRPDAKLSNRGFGTLVRTDPVFLGLQKTRLLDPLLSFPGTNDHPGDYRGSGCTGCHVVYANDEDGEHSGPYARYGHGGQTDTVDRAIREHANGEKNTEPGHPIHHVFAKTIPSSQCMVCHVHPGTNMVASYFGDTWWDNEIDAEEMYPKNEKTKKFIQKNPTETEYHSAHEKNPDGSAAKGLWSDLWNKDGTKNRTNDDFLSKTGSSAFNQQLQHTQFDDFHSHGWIFRKVFKQDRYGNLLGKDDQPIPFDKPDKFQNAVPLKDIHLEKGMHCIDCHFNQDVHGNGKLYGETRNAIEIACTDCHGTVDSYATLVTSGPAAPKGGTPMLAMQTPWKKPRFFWKDGELYQRSSVKENKDPWKIVQVKDIVNSTGEKYAKARLAKTLWKDGMTRDKLPTNHDELAHPMSKMTCVSCHSSWTTTCFGCHLPMTANQRMPMLHNEGAMTRNWTEYDFQVLRNDMYMLGKDGTVTGNKVAPIRSACAVVVSSQNQNRDWIYYGQQTVSAAGLSGTAFSPYVPHTVRSKETRSCTDCHVSAANDNNAWMAQLLLLGNNFLNYLGRYAYVATEKKGFAAIAFAELKEPEAVIGSDFHEIAYPDNFEQHRDRGQRLTQAYEHPGKEVLDVQLRGEYLYAAMGKGGLRVYDVANIENKDFSQRMITAPVSPLGQQFYVDTKYAAAVAAPSTTAIDAREPYMVDKIENGKSVFENGKKVKIAINEEQRVHDLYKYLYVADKVEGLVVIGDTKDSKTPGVSTLLDGEPRNNFLKRAILDNGDRSFNPKGQLNGARRIVFAGVYAYVLCDAGLKVVNLDNPLQPDITETIPLNDPRGIGIQFRYAFAVDKDGLKVLDVTNLATPRMVRNVDLKLENGSKIDAKNITVSRTYAYVAAGQDGMAIVNIEEPEQPKLYRMFNANGKLHDTRDIKIGMVSSSQFALVADGNAGFKVVQLFSPRSVPGFAGFSPVPNPQLVAFYQTRGPAVAISRGVDRDRAVDESGNQLSVFGRRGSRPFWRKEMEQLFLCNKQMQKSGLCRTGELYTVTDNPEHPVQHGNKKETAEHRGGR